MNNVTFVEMLLHPDNYLLAVRPSTDKARNGIKWVKLKEDTYQPRTISGTAFLKDIYEIYGWRVDCKYRVRGIIKQKSDETVYMFDMKETEVFIPNESAMQNNEEEPLCKTYVGIKPFVTTPKTFCAYPSNWVGSFGDDYYRHAQAREMRIFSETGEWNIQTEGDPFNESPLQVTSGEEIEIHIAQIIEEMKIDGK